MCPVGLGASLEWMRIVVGMSGGVDSSVAAAVLCEEGHEVIGATLRLVTADGEDPAPAAAARNGAHLGIAHRIIDRRVDFDRAVLRPCWAEYARGRTPNPCVLCNPGFKLRHLLLLADALGADRVATGHHARIETDSGHRAVLRRGSDPDKDQSYFLARLTGPQLAHLLLPVGGRTKGEVRALATRFGLPAADRPESQDVCFAGKREGFAEELRRRYDAPARPGAIVDDAGHVLGRHEGLHRYTIGQRRGLGLAMGERVWVKALDPGTSRLTVTTDPDALLSDTLTASGMIWAGGSGPDPRRVEIQIRARHRPAPARVIRCANGSISARFDRPQRAVTPGQAAVVYKQDRVLGCGWIDTGDIHDP